MKQITCKWPQVIITGQKIEDRELIKDMIIKTDFSISNFCEYSGNNRQFRTLYQEHSGYKFITDLANFLKSKDVDLYTFFDIKKDISNYIGFLDLEYFSTDTVSSCFIYGPHGWIRESGIIEFTNNVGKWPSTEELMDELSLIAKTWPMLKLNATVHDTEECSDNHDPLFNIKVENGIATYIDEPDLSVHNNLINNFDRPMDHPIYTHEQGVSHKMILEIASYIKSKLINYINNHDWSQYNIDGLQEFIEQCKLTYKEDL